MTISHIDLTTPPELDPDNPENYECETCGQVNDLTEVDFCDTCSEPLLEGDCL